MKGSDWVKTIPADRGPARDAAIYAALAPGSNLIVLPTWFEVKVEDLGKNIRARYLVTNAMCVGEPGDSVRPMVTHQTAQRIADAWNSVLPTMQIADQMFAQAWLQLDPGKVWFQGCPTTSAAMLKQSQNLDKLILGRQGNLNPIVVDKVVVNEGFIANEGKHWINHSRLGKPVVYCLEQGNPKNGQPIPGTINGVNYGWHSAALKSGFQTTLPGVRATQNPGGCHDFNYHTDYSQLLYLVARRVVLNLPYDFPVSEPALTGYQGFGSVDGASCKLPNGTDGVTKEMDIANVVQDPLFANVIKKGDPGLNFMRHPAVPGPGGGSGGGFKIPPFPLPSPPAPPEPPPDVAAVSFGGKVVVLSASCLAGWYGMGWLRRAALRSL